MPLRIQKIVLLIALATVILGGQMGRLLASSDDSSSLLSEQCDSTTSDQSTLLVLESKKSTSDIDPTLLDATNEKKSTLDIPKPEPEPPGICTFRSAKRDAEVRRCPFGGTVCIHEGRRCGPLGARISCRTIIVTREVEDPVSKEKTRLDQCRCACMNN